MKDVATFIEKARDIYGYQHFLNDTGGSVCEINSPDAERAIAENTVLLYIRADEDMEQELIDRARSNPKPLYYDETFLRARVDEYLQAEGIGGIAAMDPRKFAQWVFPELVRHRRPLYQSLADRYGYTVTAAEASQVASEADFLTLVEDAIRRS